MSPDDRISSDVETYSFVVICREAEQVFLMGDFNSWSTCATPMRETEEHIWEMSLDLPPGDHHFSYFVIDRRSSEGQTASFGSTYLLPGTWAAIVRSPSQPPTSAESANLRQ